MFYLVFLVLKRTLLLLSLCDFLFLGRKTQSFPSSSFLRLSTNTSSCFNSVVATTGALFERRKSLKDDFTSKILNDLQM